ncbi:MAG: hypothetical protein JSR36_05225 [Proteobacteria bacterium]|nr:hypothetical protein [Pseudomonadota bacterium]
MQTLFEHPAIFGGLVFLLLWGAALATGWFVRTSEARHTAAKEDVRVLTTAVLTLLGLIIGFTFSMAISRYDLRKGLEEAEANAIGTEYSRADLLPAAEAATIRQLLKEYTRARIFYYRPLTLGELEKSAAIRRGLQQELWSAVVKAAVAQPTPTTALVVAGMNDVLNSEGYTQGAWLNRVPVEAWALLLFIALVASVMIVSSAPSLQRHSPLLLILPTLVAISLMIIADIDSPRGGLIVVGAPNLEIVLGQMR